MSFFDDLRRHSQVFRISFKLSIPVAFSRLSRIGAMFASLDSRSKRAFAIELRSLEMPRGDKSKYTDKQKRMAQHIEDGYRERGVAEDEAEQRAWATVNAIDHGGKKSGSGRGQPRNPEPSQRGGEKGGAASAARPASERSASAKKAAATRKRNAKA